MTNEAFFEHQLNIYRKHFSGNVLYYGIFIKPRTVDFVNVKIALPATFENNFDNGKNIAIRFPFDGEFELGRFIEVIDGGNYFYTASYVLYESDIDLREAVLLRL